MRSEFEYEIPLADADEMLTAFCGAMVVKRVRHCASVMPGASGLSMSMAGSLAGFVCAEVELRGQDEFFMNGRRIGSRMQTFAG